MYYVKQVAGHIHGKANKLANCGGQKERTPIAANLLNCAAYVQYGL